MTSRARLKFRVSLPVFTLVISCALAVAPPSTRAQTFQVLHNFTGGADGGGPMAGVTLDAGGNLYGTTQAGGYTGGSCSRYGCGVVYRLKHVGSDWTLTPLYSFHDNDGNVPVARVVFGPDGSLFGTTYQGGDEENGVVFNLRPASTVCKEVLCPWTETVIHYFTNNPDGCLPGLGDLTFDSAGNIYGTTEDCGEIAGIEYNGTVFELTPSSGGWQESILYRIDEQGVGEYPLNSAILDSQGNLYTTTEYSDAPPPNEWGTVIQLVNSFGWTGSDIHVFTGGPSDGNTVYGGLVFDQAGNLYGDTFLGGENNGGTVFAMSPSNGGWTFNVIYSFTGSGPWASLTIDAAGNLYGTSTGSGAYGYGNVFKLTPSNGGWTYTSLHDFTGGSDGKLPVSVVSIDGNGNLYGTTSEGGADGKGVVWEITP